VSGRRKPSWFIVANNDRTVHPDLERFAAKRMNVDIHANDSSHVPRLSNPDIVVDVIRAAAKAGVRGDPHRRTSGGSHVVTIAAGVSNSALRRTSMRNFQPVMRTLQDSYGSPQSSGTRHYAAGRLQ